MPPRVNLPVEVIAARYKGGENTYELGRAYGVSHDTVLRRLHAAGVKVRPGLFQPGNRHGPGAPVGNKYSLGRHKRGGPLHTCQQGYLRTSDRAGNVCLVHRGCWEAHHGPIPNGYVIHHIDENRQHHAIENLVCMPIGAHVRMHARGGSR